MNLFGIVKRFVGKGKGVANMAHYQHCYDVLLVGENPDLWVRVWAHNREELHHIVSRRYPGMRIERIDYIK